MVAAIVYDHRRGARRGQGRAPATPAWGAHHPHADAGRSRDHPVRMMRLHATGPSFGWRAFRTATRRYPATDEGGTAMADLIAIGYPDETTAAEAAEEVKTLTRDLIIEPDAVAVIVRDQDGKYKVTTSHHPVGGGASWGMFWGLLFGLLFFVPVFGMAVGAGLGALMGKVEKTGIDKQFQDQVRDMVQPGTSALFLVVEKVTPDKAIEGLSRFGGTVLKSSLSKDAEHDLQDALHGSSAAA
jgi:uncharacterized membrane protein